MSVTLRSNRRLVTDGWANLAQIRYAEIMLPAHVLICLRYYADAIVLMLLVMFVPSMVMMIRGMVVLV